MDDTGNVPLSEWEQQQQQEEQEPLETMDVRIEWLVDHQFVVIAGSIAVLELILGAWPVVATSIWGARAVDTWIHFLWWVKAILLGLALVQMRWRAPKKRRHGRSGKSIWWERSVTYFEICMGATASCEISTWILVSIVGHALLSAVLLLLVAVLKSEFTGDVQWALSLAFDIVGIAESLLSPFVLTAVGMDWLDDSNHDKDPHPRIPWRFADAPTRVSTKRVSTKRVTFGDIDSRSAYGLLS